MKIAASQNKSEEERAVLTAELEKTRQGLRLMAAELKKANSAQVGSSSSSLKTKDSAEMKVMQKKLLDLERKLEASEAQKKAAIGEALEEASNRQEAFLLEQSRVNADAVGQAMSLARESWEGLSAQNLEAISADRKAMTSHLAEEAEKRRVHELKIAEAQKQAAEAQLASSENQTKQTVAALTAVHQTMELVSSVVSQV
jgi:hypothetical protein